jgi:hypothetical protein
VIRSAAVRRNEARADLNPVTGDGDYRRLLDSGFSIIGLRPMISPRNDHAKRFELRMMPAAMIVNMLESIHAAL